MSLHIESTENALAELKKQRTKTLTAAISVSFLGIALMGLLLYLVHIIVAVPEDPPMVAYATQEGDNPDIDTPEVTQTTQRPSSSSTSAQVKVIAAVATADVAVVNPDIEVDVPSEELSMGIDIGDGFGTGTGDGDGGGIPGIISKRCDLNDRMKRITENVKSNLYMHYYCVQAAMNRGGDVWTSYNKAFRDAVLSGQNADGSFRKNDVGYVSGMSNKSENIYRQCLATLMLETYYRFLPGTGEGTKNS